MKAIINPAALAKVLKKASPAIKKNSVLPILSCVKLQFEKTKLTVYATDLETSIVSTLDCEGKDTFDVVIEYASIADICSKISEPILIEEKDEKILITGDESKFKFSKVEGEHFPKIEAKDFLFDIDVDSDFFWALSCANTCKSLEDTRVGLNAPCVHIKKDSVSLVGTDALVLYKKTLKIKTGKEIQMMVPEQFVQMTKAFSEGKISVSEKFIKVQSGETTIISLLLEGKYCLYETILPKEIEFNFTINRNELIKSLQITGVAANTSTHLSRINFNGGDIKIVTQDIDYGREAEIKVKSIHSVEIERIGVNGSQMLKLLGLMDSEEVEMSFTDERKTIFLRPAGEPNVLCLVQPLMLD